MGVNGHWYVEIEKQAWWRGSQHTWVNRYIMSGAQPAASDATTVITALHGIENQLYPAVAGAVGVGFVEGRAYPSGKGSSFASVEYNQGGAPGTATGFTGPGQTPYLSFGATLESCVLIETKLTGLSSTGKPVYLRKYMRGFNANQQDAASGEGIQSSILTIMNGIVAPWRTGVGSNGYVVIGASGAQAASAPATYGYIANRQVPKGRKKKTTSAPALGGILEDLARAKSILGSLPDLPAAP